jgi:predicted RNA-binding protein associated with RNAse of E/G family
MRPGDAYSLDLFWDDATGDFLCWYVNLQAPFERSPLGFDTVDQALDIVVSPDGQWRWKDEDDLERCVELELFSPSEAAEIRAEGERVIAALQGLIPTGWENWRADPAWQVPPLPRGWSNAGNRRFDGRPDLS